MGASCKTPLKLTIMGDIGCEIRQPAGTDPVVPRMLAPVELEPVWFVPFVSSVMDIEPGWIDYNGHLNMAYYHVLFDRAVDEAFAVLGIGPSYVTEQRRSLFTAEVHVRYLRELHAGDPIRITLQLLDCDAKRLHFFEHLFHAAEGWLAAFPSRWRCTSMSRRRRRRPSPNRSLSGWKI